MYTGHRPCGGCPVECRPDLLEFDPVVAGPVPGCDTGGGLAEVPDDWALVVDGGVEGEGNLRSECQ